jgi:hypothetical protein
MISGAPSSDFGGGGGGGPMGFGGLLQNLFNNANAMYAPPQQMAATGRYPAQQTYLPGTLNSSNPWSLDPVANNAVGGYSPLTMQQQQPQQKMGNYNATMK